MSGEGSDLVSFVASMGGERQLRVEENLGEGYVRLRVAEAERRQAKHDIRCVEDVVIEMLRNARDAGARHIYVATTRVGNLRTTTMLDDGSGIPLDMQARIFEARVTSKLESVRMDRWGVHGRGMALYSVKENSVSAEVMSSAVGKGSSIRVVTDADVLSERADQSSWPSVGVDDDGEQSCVRGPHNIVRTCCEFALEERGTCEVYLGSPAEIAATARARAARSVDMDLSVGELGGEDVAGGAGGVVGSRDPRGERDVQDVEPPFEEGSPEADVVTGRDLRGLAVLAGEHLGVELGRRIGHAEVVLAGDPVELVVEVDELDVAAFEPLFREICRRAAADHITWH